MRAGDLLHRTSDDGLDIENPLRGVKALKGNDFSRANDNRKWNSALAAEGVRVFKNAFSRGLKPRFWLRMMSGLKPVPFIAAALLIAAGIPSSAQQAPTAHELAQRVDHHYNQLHSLKAGFTESYEGLGMHRAESGTLSLLKPGRMRWDYSSPSGKLFLLDGKYAWFYSKGDPQVQRMAAKQLDDLRSPLRFLLGHTELEKEMDSVTLAPVAGGRFTLSGQPKGQEKRVNRLTLTVTAEGTITGIEIEEADGAITRFIFSGELPNAPVPADEFHFTPPAGVPVVNADSPV